MLATFCCGCAAINVAISKKDLKVETTMSESIFMDPENGADRSVFIDVRDSTDRNIYIGPRIETHLQAKGYRYEDDPKKAGYILQVNVLQVGMADPNAYQAAVKGGHAFWGSTAASMGAGAAAGALIGYGATRLSGTGALTGGLIGGVAAGLIDIVINSAVKDVTYAIITDVLVSVRTSGEISEQSAAATSNRVLYATRIGSSANKVNLSFAEARPELEEGLAWAIAGIF